MNRASRNWAARQTCAPLRASLPGKLQVAKSVTLARIDIDRHATASKFHAIRSDYGVLFDDALPAIFAGKQDLGTAVMNEFTCDSRTLMRRMITAIFFVSVAAQYVAPARAEETALPRVGVISMAGDVIFQRRLGVTAFGNDWSEFDAADLHLDDAWEDKIEETLSPFGRWDFVDIVVDRAPLFTTYNKGTIVNNWRFLRFKKTAPIFAAIAAENQLDYIIVLGADVSGTDSPVRREGAGIFTSKRIGGESTAYHLIAQLALIDGANGKPISKEYLLVGRPGVRGSGGFPEIDAPAELTGKIYSDYTPEEKATLRATFVAIGDNAWARSLSKMLELEAPADAGGGGEEPTNEAQETAPDADAGGDSTEAA